MAFLIAFEEALRWTFPDSKAVLTMLGWTEEQFWAEVEFVEKVLQTHTDENENSTAIRICHNDLHPGKLKKIKYLYQTMFIYLAPSLNSVYPY